jgi:predicted transcriptional regulator
MMEFDLAKIDNKKDKKGSGNRKVTNEEIIAALQSGLFDSQAAIARYYGVTPQALGQRIKRMREKGIIQ